MAVTDMIASHRSRRGFSIIELLMVVAVGATLMAVGTPVLRGAMANQRLRAGAADVGNALSEARREAFRTSTTARIEVDPADGRISVFAWDSAANAEAERKRYYLPVGVQFNNIAAVTSYTFDTLGRPAVLPMSIQLRLANTTVVRTVSVLGTGRTTET
jgi:prepilin-type N-terminal cleavage/methylation domain-containing protein